MKKVFISAVILAIFSFAACHSSESGKEQRAQTFDSFAIIGKITGQDSGMVYIMRLQSKTKDSAKLDHGYFTFKGKADSVEYCLLSIGDQSKGFFLENGKLSMLIKKDSLSDALISGTPAQDEYNHYQESLVNIIDSPTAALNRNYDAAKARKDKKLMDSLDKLYDTLDNKQKKIVTDYVKAHPASYVAAYEISHNFYYNPDPNQLDSLYKTLDASVRSGFFGRRIRDMVTKARLTAIGNTAPTFTSSDAKGNPISLFSFRNKYVLVDFWASWCGPCREENPAVVRAYQQFHNKGFEILGVSLDTKKESWEEAIKKDGLTWSQVSDLKGWKNDAAIAYGVEAIPMNFLLDKDGKIIAKGLRGEELTKKLQEVIH